MKINFACGKKVLPGFYNIDAEHDRRASRAPDLLYTMKFDRAGNLKTAVPLPSGVCKEMHSYHFIEHVFAWEAPSVIREFRRLLEPGGLLVLELPDIQKAARNLLEGSTDQYSMWPLYGDPKQKKPFMCHKWGYTPRTIVELVAGEGFRSVRVRPPQTKGQKLDRDMRVEAIAT